ncbi:MAG: lipid A biosynthesis lauroyl [Gallionellaceae bacterium]|nr:MAG: lipid A biosynthesis lauroyl [Gallionellaceae bacterium]
MALVFKLLACLPLAVLHHLGTVLGWIAYLSSGRYAGHLRQNLASALKFGQGKEGFPEVDFNKVLHASVSEAGKSIMELPWVWQRPLDEVVASVVQCYGWEHVEAAHAQGNGVIMLTPHFGCFELISLYVAVRLPMTCMYRVPKLVWLDKVMREGRERGQMKLARADIGGVRILLKALKRGEIIGVLPDQVPGNGEGEWVPFFGRPAYTITLIGRLMEASGATVIMSHIERLPRGNGHILRFTPLSFDTSLPVGPQMNAAIEAVVLSCPQQYLWSYNRYKVPRGAPVPDAVKEQA